MFIKISLGIITVAALLFIGACVVVIAALNDLDDELDDPAGSSSSEEVFIEIEGKPGTTCAIERLEGLGLDVPALGAICTVPGRFVLAPANTNYGDRLTATIRQTSNGSLTFKVHGCKGKLAEAKTDDADDVVTVGCD